ncbi:hypothetical protein BYT27DRAFT_7296993 [Phlegmacium glaucopus]|nr:hypothetical protein BYT27DRAFT_7296993 [Phlegmacium glaucopus]
MASSFTQLLPIRIGLLWYISYPPTPGILPQPLTATNDKSHTYLLATEDMRWQQALSAKLQFRQHQLPSPSSPSKWDVRALYSKYIAPYSVTVMLDSAVNKGPFAMALWRCPVLSSAVYDNGTGTAPSV